MATHLATYLAFLRAINLGANRKFPKDAIVQAAEEAGFADVATYINTGNVRVRSSIRSGSRVEAALEEAFHARAGFEVPTIVLTPAELLTVAADAAELHRPGLERHYLYLLKSEPDPERVAALEERSRGVVVVRHRAAHVLLGPGHRPGTVDPYGVERALDVVATNRNLNVVTTLAQRWCS